MNRMIQTLAVATLLLTSAYAQSTVVPGQPVTGTEIFITHNWGLNGITSGTTFWDNVILQDLSGLQYTATFAALVSSATGTYGPVYTVGPYLFEYFWLGATFVPNGITPGHIHTNTTLGNPAECEGTHGNGAQQNQGIRVTRSDSAAFYLISIDYKAAFEPFLIGNFYSAYTDLATWGNYDSTQGLVLNSYRPPLFE